MNQNFGTHKFPPSTNCQQSCVQQQIVLEDCDLHMFWPFWVGPFLQLWFSEHQRHHGGKQDHGEMAWQKCKVPGVIRWGMNSAQLQFLTENSDTRECQAQSPGHLHARNVPTVLALSPHSQMWATFGATGFFQQPMSSNNDCVQLTFILPLTDTWCHHCVCSSALDFLVNLKPLMLSCSSNKMVGPMGNERTFER